MAAYAVLAALPTQDEDNDVDVEVDVLEVDVEEEEDGIYCTVASAY